MRVTRKEDSRHLHGRGNFVSDMILPGQQEVAFLRSPVAHGAIRSITKPAGKEGSVFVREDVAALAMLAPSSLPGYKNSEQHPLAHEKVRFVGEPVAMCFAPSRAQAEDLTEQIVLDIEDLPALVDATQVRLDSSVRVHDDWADNLFVTIAVDRDFEQHARAATVVVKREVELSRQAMVPMEGKAVLACWDDRADQLVVYSSTQMPHVIRVGLAQHLGVEERQIRVIAPDVGGGFGYKSVFHPEELCVAWLALKFRKPFRWIEDRREHLVSGAVARQHHYTITGYANSSGRLLALDAEMTVDGGAYSNWPFTVALEPGQGLGNLPGPYDFRGYRCKAYCVATNKPPFMPYRGVARTGVCLAIEMLMDAIANAVNRDPWDVRHENLVPGSAMPYNNVIGKHYDSGDYRKAFTMVREQIGYEAVRARQARGEADGRFIGLGVVAYCEQSAHGTDVFAALGAPIVPGHEQATVRTTPDGGLEVRVGLHSHGQGMETTLAQVANQVLGVPIARIQVVHGDTAMTPFSTGTYSSRGMVMAGGAVAAACEELVERYRAIGAHLLKCAIEETRFECGTVVGALASVSLKQIAETWYLRPHELPRGVHSGGLEATVGFKPSVDTGAFSYASHAAVVAVDTELGRVEILDYVVTEDCGTMVNPLVVEGQIYGGIAQGIGTALYEEVQYDVNGQPNASTLADYLLPGPTELPAVRIAHIATPSPYTAFGIKGMAEGGAIPPPAVILSAVNDALRTLGVEVNSTPLTPRKLLEAIDKAAAVREPRRKAT